MIIAMKIDSKLFFLIVVIFVKDHPIQQIRK